MPLSIEELLEKRRQEKEGLSKPVFLTKEQRAEIALEKRKAQVDGFQNEKNYSRATSRDLFSISKPPASQIADRKRGTTREREDPLKEELSLIKAKYLGGDERGKRKVRKMNEKKFVFDWANDEDTSIEGNPLYKNKKTVELIGRSKIAGYELLDKVSKETHWSLRKLAEMTERDWRIFKEDYSITVKGSNVPHPLRSWKESPIPPPILRVIDKVGYKEPTPIQRQAIPIAIQGRDIIGVAETGSGKTASFVIPMLCFIKDLPPLDHGNSHLGPYALVLAPTRELALQIESEATKFAKAMNFICVSIVGGHTVESQTTNLLSGAHIIIATPGRLRDLIDRRILALAQCVYVVLDEADRMVDLGFEPDLKYILASMPASNLKPDNDRAEDMRWLNDQIKAKNPFRQTVMFSATMPPPVEQLAKEYLRRPVNVTVGVVGQVVDRIEQRIEMINDEGAKLTRIQRLFTSGEFEAPIIVFVNQKKNCDSVAKVLEQRGFRCAVLHGGKSQDQREAALAGLKEGTKEVLIATDVAGRGIDVKNVSLVVNFDMAKSIEDYTHRIGRTGRAGRKGCAITFLSSCDTEVYWDLKMVLQKSPLSKAPKEFYSHEASMQKPSISKQGQGGANIV